MDMPVIGISDWKIKYEDGLYIEGYLTYGHDGSSRDKIHRHLSDIDTSTGYVTAFYESYKLNSGPMCFPRVPVSTLGNIFFICEDVIERDNLRYLNVEVYLTELGLTIEYTAYHKKHIRKVISLCELLAARDTDKFIEAMMLYTKAEFKKGE